MRITDRNENPFDSYRRTSMLAPQRETTTMPTFQSNGPDLNSLGSDPGKGMGTQYDRMGGYDNEIMDLLKPSPGLLAYKNYLTTMPQREDYKPSGWTRAAAGLSGLSAGMRNAGEGIKVAQGINESGYRSAMEDYGVKGSGLRETADIEQSDRDNKIKTIQQARALGLKYDELEQKRDEFKTTSGQTDFKNNTERARVRAYIDSVTRGEYDVKDMADGGYLMINKRDSSDTRRISPQEAGGVSAKFRELGQQDFTNRTGRINAGANVLGAKTGADRLTWEQERGAEPPGVEDVTRAEDAALSRLARDPQFGRFVISDEKGTRVNPAMSNDPDFEIFEEAMNTLARAYTDGNALTNVPKVKRNPGYRIGPVRK